MSIRLGRADLVDVVEVEVEDKVTVEFEAEVEEVDFEGNLDGLGGSLNAFVGTGLGSFSLLNGNESVKYLTGGGK